MVTTGKKGFAFSIDLATAFIAMLLMLSLMLTQLNSLKENRLAALEKISLEERAIFIADTIVKNRSENQPLDGSALYDEEKHRVLQNQVDLDMLLKAKPKQAGNYTVSRLSITSGGKKQEIFSEAGEKTLQAEYCFTGGLMKNNQVVAEIAGKQTKLLFTMPAGYTIRETVIG